MLRYFNAARQINLDNEDGRFWNVGYNFFESTRQLPLGSPSVFNFYPPDYVPNSEFTEANLLGPEFRIHNSATALAFVNEVDLWTYPEYYSILQNWEEGIEQTPLDFEALKYYAKDSEVLINQLDKLFTRGQLSDETRTAIKDAIDGIYGNDPNVDYNHYRVKMGLYLILISPDYAILK